MRLCPFLAAAAMLAASLAAHADTLTFTVTETLYHGSAQGTLTLDESTGLATSGSITVTDYGLTETFSNTADRIDTGSNGVATEIEFGTPGSDDDYLLYFPGTSLVGFSGGEICAINQALPGCYQTTSSFYVSGTQLAGAIPDAALTGSLVVAPATVPTSPTSLTPEPSSFALLGTGLLAVAGVVRKRLA